jgi:hypothetical protein
MAGIRGKCFSRRELPGNTHLPGTPDTSRTKEAVMGINAWLVLGLAAGLLATMLIPGRRSQGLAITACHPVSGRDGHRMAHR